MTDKYLIDESKRRSDCAVMLKILDTLKLKGYEIKINPYVYLNLSQFLKFNSKFFVSESIPELYDPIGIMTKTNYAYIYIPDYIGYYSENITRNIDLSNKFSHIMLRILDTLSKKNPAGWVFDLRYNTGGIIYSFIYAFLSILSPFTINCKNIKGEIKTKLVYDGEQLYFQRENEQPEVIGLMPPVVSINLSNVHVFINGETASCGELLTYLLKKQHNATIHGTPSYGLSSWMEYYEIPGFSNVVIDDVVLRYPELIFDFSDSDIQTIKLKKYKNTPVLSIKPDKENFPYKMIGMF